MHTQHTDSTRTNGRSHSHSPVDCRRVRINSRVCYLVFVCATFGDINRCTSLNMLRPNSTSALEPTKPEPIHPLWAHVTRACFSHLFRVIDVRVSEWNYLCVHMTHCSIQTDMCVQFVLLYILKKYVDYVENSTIMYKISYETIFFF